MQARVFWVRLAATHRLKGSMWNIAVTFKLRLRALRWGLSSGPLIRGTRSWLLRLLRIWSIKVSTLSLLLLLTHWLTGIALVLWHVILIWSWPWSSKALWWSRLSASWVRWAAHSRWSKSTWWSLLLLLLLEHGSSVCSVCTVLL